MPPTVSDRCESISALVSLTHCPGMGASVVIEAGHLWLTTNGGLFTRDSSGAWAQRYRGQVQDEVVSLRVLENGQLGFVALDYAYGEGALHVLGPDGHDQAFPLTGTEIWDLAGADHLLGSQRSRLLGHTSQSLWIVSQRSDLIVKHLSQDGLTEVGHVHGGSFAGDHAIVTDAGGLRVETPGGGVLEVGELPGLPPSAATRSR